MKNTKLTNCLESTFISKDKSLVTPVVDIMGKLVFHSEEFARKFTTGAGLEFWMTKILHDDLTWPMLQFV